MEPKRDPTQSKWYQISVSTHKTVARYNAYIFIKPYLKDMIDYYLQRFPQKTKTYVFPSQRSGEPLPELKPPMVIFNDYLKLIKKSQYAIVPNDFRHLFATWGIHHSNRRIREHIAGVQNHSKYVTDKYYDKTKYLHKCFTADIFNAELEN